MASRRRLTAERALELFYAIGSDEESDGEQSVNDDPDYQNDSDLQNDVPEVCDTPSTSSGSTRSSRPSSTVTVSNNNNGSDSDSGGDDSPSDVDLDLDQVRGINEAIGGVDEEEDTDEWVRNTNNFPKVPEFTGDSGLKFDVGDDPTPYDIYSLIITEELLRDWKREINSYAKAAIDAKKRTGVTLSPRSKFNEWKPVTIDEVRIFIANCIHMGFVDKPWLHDYWSKDPAVHTSFSAKTIDRDRFMAILGFFHISDNGTYIPYGEDDHDPVHKIRPFMDHLNDRFKALYVPNRKIAVDEAMCPFKGRSRFKVYMKDKPVKWGFKFYELCESSSGYVFNFEMFCSDKRFSNKPTDVVLRLMDPLLNKGYHLYIDNYYCCPDLVSRLLEKKTMTCGTVRKNRIGMPKDLATQRVLKGELDYRRKGQLLVTKWVDKREVYTLSTMSQPELREVQARFELKRKPLAVIDYVKHMAGVDLSDQLLSYFPMHRRSLKWWKKPFFHLLTLAMVQTSILLNKYRALRGKKKVTLHHVVKKVMNALVDVPPVEAAADGPRLDFERLNGKHFPSEVPKPEGKKSAAYRNCKVCHRNH